MSFTKLRRSMTQSEKQRRFVDKNPSYNTLTTRGSKYRSAQIVECPQNVVELRKLLQNCQHIDREKKKAAAKINHEKHTLRKYYKRHLKGDELLKEETDFDLPAGFRYKSNGELKSSDIQASTREKSVACIEKRLSNLCMSRCHATSASKEKLSPGGHASAAKRLSRIEIQKEIEQIEKDLRELKQHNTIVDINSRISIVKDQISQVRVSAGDSTETKAEKKKPETTTPGPRVTRNPQKTKGSGSKFSPDRFSRRFSRVNCAACEARMKHTTSDTATEKKSVSKKPVRRWVSAPQGVYVKKLESHSQNSMIPGRFKGRRDSNTTTGSVVNNSLTTKVKGRPQQKAIAALKQRHSGSMDVTHSDPEVRMRESFAKVKTWQRNSFQDLERSASDGGRRVPPRQTRQSVSSKITNQSSLASNKSRNPPVPSKPTRSGQMQGGTLPSRTPKKVADVDILHVDDGKGKERCTEEHYRYVMHKSRISNKNNLATLDELCKDKLDLEDTLEMRSSMKAKKSSSNNDSLSESRYSNSNFDFRKSLAQLETERAISKIRMRNRAEVDQELAVNKVTDFLGDLPPPSCSIDRWRNSHGQLVNNKTAKTSSATNNVERTESLTWAEYRKSQDDLKDEASKGGIGQDATSLYLRRQQEMYDNLSPSRKVSQEEMAKCRYLRLMPEQLREYNVQAD